MIEIQVSDEDRHALSATDLERMHRATTAILTDHGVVNAEVSLAIVNDEAIHQLNRDHLQHDYPTDVLSFLFERWEEGLAGEVIVSWDTAVRSAAEYHWSAAEELLLYVIHGTLHLVGYEDNTGVDCLAMRNQEDHYLGLLGLEQPARAATDSPAKNSKGDSIR